MVGGYTGQHKPELQVTTKKQDMDEVECKIHQRSYINLSCRYCDEGSHETQEHIETKVCKFEGKGLDLSRWVVLVIFWRRMTAKIAATVALGHVSLITLSDIYISLLYHDIDK